MFKGRTHRFVDLMLTYFFRFSKSWTLVVFILTACGEIVATHADEMSPLISAGRPAESGWFVHTVTSDYQAGETEIRVLLPDDMQTGERLPVIYVLPVEANNEKRYGDGLLEVKEQNLHNVQRAIFVAPAFSRLPWYADHATDTEIRQESYFIKVVVPFVDSAYPTISKAENRFLLGFSKSGWGAWSLLLRHPDLFGRAASWDAPLMMDHLGKYGTTGIFGSEEVFVQYRIPDLMRKYAHQWQGSNRLVLTGYDTFRSQHQQMHNLLSELNIPHDYCDGPFRKHNWHSGWVAESVLLLMPTNN